MQVQPGDGLPSIANIIDRDAEVGDNTGILQEVERMGGVDPPVSDVVAEGIHLDFFQRFSAAAIFMAVSLNAKLCDPRQWAAMAANSSAMARASSSLA